MAIRTFSRPSSAATETKRQPACKPGSVWQRHEYGIAWQPFLWDRICILPLATNPGDDPETGPDLRPRHPYSVLLPVGFAMPFLSPATRWALTPPFHPYPAGIQVRDRTGIQAGRFTFCGTIPGVAPAGCYPAPCFRGARTFLTADRSPKRGCPAG
ncbi:MAG: hypothetical protein MnENMB40S_00030 [Rhizobiaceae bacterium MnEN-MB40S]|nr:MAG: hypothetical protein MnENMB40S_00030 [Rhizobiaceae bacterium MnEN-MB40S]